MKRDSIWGFAGLMALMMIGCAEGESGVTPDKVEPECKEGETSCHTDGNLNVCIDGKFQLSRCSHGCFKGKCIEPGGNVTDEPGDICNDATYGNKCKNEKTQLYCEGGVIQAKSCEGNQVCNAAGECSEAGSGEHQGDKCGSAYVAKCLDTDPQSRMYCDAGKLKTERCTDDYKCEAGSCVVDTTYSNVRPGNTCNMTTFRDICSNESMRLFCANGTITAEPCLPTQTCMGGMCVAAEIPSKGAPCDKSGFQQVCKDANTLYICKDSNGAGIVDEVTCPTDCYLGACLSSCPETMKPFCKSDNVALKCVGGQYTQEPCGAGKHCIDGTCEPNADPGTECTREGFERYCITSNQYNNCVLNSDGKGLITSGMCKASDGGTVCVNGQCQECDSTGFSVTCADTQSRKLCLDGKLVDQACPENTPYCQDGNCVACLAGASFKATCTDDKHFTSCDNGVLVTHECAGSLKCAEGVCTGECDDDHPCGEHYACVSSHCELNKECDLSEAPVCDTENKGVKRCAGAGWYETTACNDGDTCVDGKCVGHECDSASYGSACALDGKTPLYCLDGHILKSSPCASGICISGACRDCDPDKYIPNKCYDNSHVMICKDYSLSWYTSCKPSETCIEGSGCVSKCGAGFKDQCLSEKELRYCTNDGVTTTKTCEDISKCVDGECVSDYGKPCNPDTFKPQCYSDVGLKVCEPDSSGNYKYNYIICSSDSFCGVSGGVNGCFKSCTIDTSKPGSEYNCLYNDKEAWAVKCSSAVDFNGTARMGYVKVNAYCYNGASVSCRLNSYHALVHDRVYCAASGGTTCNESTGLCNGISSCATPGGSCSGGTTAINCMPFGSQNVQTVMNCSAYANATCVTYTMDSVTYSACKAEGESSSGVIASTLGKCDGNTLNKLYFTDTTGAGMIISTPCQSDCVYETSNGVTFAYCK